jgi:hypothetical protein
MTEARQDFLSSLYLVDEFGHVLWLANRDKHSNHCFICASWDRDSIQVGKARAEPRTVQGPAKRETICEHTARVLTRKYTLKRSASSPVAPCQSRIPRGKQPTHATAEYGSVNELPAWSTVVVEALSS